MAENEYELERQKIIAQNRLLLDSLGLDSTSKTLIPQSTSSNTTSKSKVKPTTKRKAGTSIKKEDDGPRRRSGRLLGMEAEGEELKVKLEVEEKEREEIRVASRRARGLVMELKKMVEDTPLESIPELEKYLSSIAQLPNSHPLPPKDSSKDIYADSDTPSAEVERLKSQFKDMTLQANVKVTSERVYSMVVHPEKSKTLVLVGDKQGMVGIWDALGPASEPIKPEPSSPSSIRQSPLPTSEEDPHPQGRVWRIQAHAKNSITSLKIDPINSSKLYTSAYDCSLRSLDFHTLQSRELFRFDDDNMLITHFDLLPDGGGAWMSDKEGGVSFCDFREGKGGRGSGERSRWIVQDEGRSAKLGGISVNPLMPHLLVTAGNDQHLRIWDTRHLHKLNPNPIKTQSITQPTDGDEENPNTLPTSVIQHDKIVNYMESSKGKGLLRASYQHGKSCSAAYWDPWGRRILTTSYDDKLRVFTTTPDQFTFDQPIPSSKFQPSKIISHNCQTGRWLTILRAQWSQNMDYMPHFTVGNMKRYLDVVTCTGEKIVSLWADGITAVPAVTASHPSRVDHVIGGNTSGRIQLWTAGDP